MLRRGVRQPVRIQKPAEIQTFTIPAGGPSSGEVGLFSTRWPENSPEFLKLIPNGEMMPRIDHLFAPKSGIFQSTLL